MNKLLLRLALLPAGLWKSAGADLYQLQALLDVRLKLDDRRPLNFGRQRAQKKNRRFTSVIGMLVSFFTGCVYVLPLIGATDRMLALVLYFSMFLFLLTFTLITDFSSVLIDTRDKYIVLPLPVSGRTLALSRMLHAGIYLFRIVVPMSIPGWVALGIIGGWKAALWFPLPLFLLVSTALFLVMGIYMLILQVASAGRFKDIISYFQVAFSIIIFGFYYIVPRAMGGARIGSLHIADFTWAKYIPPFWLAATWSWIYPQGMPAGSLYYSFAAILLPVGLLTITVKWLMPNFANNLGELDSAAGEGAPAINPGKVKNSPWAHRLALMLNRQPEAQAGFILAWLQTARSRAFKLKVYPVFAYVPIYFVYLLSLNKEESLSHTLHKLPYTWQHITLLYMSCVVVLQALSFGGISDHYKAAWVYYALPLQEPGALMAGSFKAMWVKYFLPFFMGISIFVLGIWGAPAIIDIALAFVNVTLFAACTARVAYRQFPFSQPEQMSNAGSKFLRVFVSLTVPGTLGIGHYLARDVWWLKGLFIVLSSILLWLVWDSYVRTAWADIKKTEE